MVGSDTAAAVVAHYLGNSRIFFDLNREIIRWLEHLSICSSSHSYYNTQTNIPLSSSAIFFFWFSSQTLIMLSNYTKPILPILKYNFLLFFFLIMYNVFYHQ